MSNPSAPWTRVTPVLVVPDVRAAVAWYADVLGLVEHVRIGKGHRAQLGLDGERAEVIVREPRDGDVPTGEVMLRVANADAVLSAARAAGATGDEDTTEFAYGERQATIVDPFGHTWVLTQSLRDVDPAQWGGESVTPRR